MKYVLNLAVTFMLLFAGAFAYSAPADMTINFDPAPVGENQKPIASYTVFKGCDSTPEPFITGITGPGKHEGVLETGQDYVLCMGSVDTDGRVSVEFSNSVYLTLRDIRGPNAPSNFRIQVSCQECVVTIEG